MFLFLPGLEPAVQKTAVTDSVNGIFIQMIDNETGYADINGEIEQCFIQEEIRKSIHKGDRVYVVKNIRDDKKTEWDVISVGERVSGLKPANTLVLHPPPPEEKVEEGFPEITLSTATAITTTTTTTTGLF